MQITSGRDCISTTVEEWGDQNKQREKKKSGWAGVVGDKNNQPAFIYVGLKVCQNWLSFSLIFFLN